MSLFKRISIAVLGASLFCSFAFSEGVSDKNSQSNSNASVGVFNPDTEKNAISYDQLESKFGPLPVGSVRGKNITMGVIMKNLANEFWIMLGDGITAEAKTDGIKIDMQASRTETDTAGQLAIAETMISNNYGALILSPLTNDNLSSAVDTARQKGIPIVNANCEYIADCNTFVGGRQIEIGTKAAEYIAKKLNGKGKVAILEGVPGTFTSIQRLAGFNQKIKEFPGIEVVASAPADYEMEKGLNVTSNILTQHPNVNAIYACNDNMALGAVEALRAVNLVGKVVVTGADGTSGAYDSIKRGEMTATADQFPGINGKAAVDVAIRLMAGQKIPKVVSTPIEMVDKDNMNRFGK
jgi:ribose transport system substrate-binding protein